MALLPQEIAERLGPGEYTKLCGLVEKRYKQAFSVISIKRTKGLIVAVVELADKQQVRVTM